MFKYPLNLSVCLQSELFFSVEVVQNPEKATSSLLGTFQLNALRMCLVLAVYLWQLDTHSKSDSILLPNVKLSDKLKLITQVSHIYCCWY